MPTQTVPKFSGFGPAALEFYKGIEKNNNQDWFNAHRDQYLSDVMLPAQAFVSALGPRLQKFSPGVQFDTDYNGRGSIKKIFTDRRFNKDRDPYKAYLDILFWEGPIAVKKENSGFYFHLDPKRIWLAAGIKYLNPEALKAYRTALTDPVQVKALEKAYREVEKVPEVEIKGKNLKKLPRGTQAEGFAAEMLLHDELYAWKEFPLPRELGSASLVDWAAAELKAMAPLHKWLVGMLTRAL